MDRNQTKVIIPDAVAAEIETYRNEGVSNSAIIHDVMDGDNTEAYVETLRSIPFDTLLAALVNGYEREKSEIEQRYDRIKSVYMSKMGIGGFYPILRGHPYLTNFAEGIKFTLNELGIVIDGVNNIESEVSANV